MTHPGSFRVASRNRAYEAYLDPTARAARRTRRILDSLRAEIEHGDTRVAARRVFERPRVIYRLEIESPALGYQRTTLLEKGALDQLLAIETVRARIRLSE